MASEPGRHLESSKRADHGLLSLGLPITLWIP
ncbi:hypothetical protein P8C59_008464 [Phyllachora maydis]|uniref:Uncharacterized protein n=1 Tax=Phyllachora maydis TaxID=1825666 RepID=A0AAD9IAM1_9PEZI|nr:hypothetical protein P8C59_008464 [Phyllachora maydis]